MKIIRIDPPLPLYIIDKGNGYAHFLIDYGIEDHLYWVIFMDDTGECWTIANPQIRMQNNPTLNRNNSIAHIKEIGKYMGCNGFTSSPISEPVKIYDGVLNSPYTL
jgi:hypothetical protein